MKKSGLSFALTAAAGVLTQDAFFTPLVALKLTSAISRSFGPAPWLSKQFFRASARVTRVLSGQRQGYPYQSSFGPAPGLSLSELCQKQDQTEDTPLSELCKELKLVEVHVGNWPFWLTEDDGLIKNLSRFERGTENRYQSALERAEKNRIPEDDEMRYYPRTHMPVLAKSYRQNRVRRNSVLVRMYELLHSLDLFDVDLIIVDWWRGESQSVATTTSLIEHHTSHEEEDNDRRTITISEDLPLLQYSQGAGFEVIRFHLRIRLNSSTLSQLQENGQGVIEKLFAESHFAKILKISNSMKDIKRWSDFDTKEYLSWLEGVKDMVIAIKQVNEDLKPVAGVPTLGDTPVTVQQCITPTKGDGSNEDQDDGWC